MAVLESCVDGLILVSVVPQAMVYFEQLKESQDAWEVCAEALAKGIYK